MHGWLTLSDNHLFPYKNRKYKEIPCFSQKDAGESPTERSAQG